MGEIHGFLMKNWLVVEPIPMNIIGWLHTVMMIFPYKPSSYWGIPIVGNPHR
jgi:hypothetical protein